jgi:hypothetical protein
MYVANTMNKLLSELMFLEFFHMVIGKKEGMVKTNDRLWDYAEKVDDFPF